MTTAYRLRWPSRQSFESTRGLLLRFAAINGFLTIEALAKVISQRLPSQVASSADVVRSPEALVALGHLAGTDVNAVGLEAWPRHPTADEDHVRYHGVVIPSDALLLDRLQLCPLCVAEAPYIRADWDLAHVVACGRHGRVLVEACSGCAGQISPELPFTGYCHKCGTAFSTCPSPNASPQALATSEDSAGLAPVLFESTATRYVAHPASFFELCRLLACSPDAMWTNKVRKVRFSTLNIGDRLQVLAELGGYRGENGYSQERLREGLAARFEHLRAFDAFGARQRRVAHLLRSSRLLPDLRNFVLHASEKDEAKPSAELLEGRTTGYTMPRDVARLLGITPEGVAWLKRHGKLNDPLDELGYSTYEILDCHDVLKSLVPCTHFDAALGVPGLSFELAQHGLLELWTLTPQRPPGLTLSSVTSLLDALRVAACRPAAEDGGERHAPSDAELLSALAPNIYGRLVVALLNGTVSGLGWQEPWRLQDLEVPEAAIRGLSR